MARRYFVGWTEEQLETLLDDLNTQQAAGKVLTNWSAGDSSAGKQVELSIDERIRRVLWDLHILNPDDYPAEDVARVRRTRMEVYDGDRQS